jgi:hypothetical protein
VHILQFFGLHASTYNGMVVGGGGYDRYVDISANRRNLPANKHLVERGWGGGGGGGGGQLTRESYMSALRAGRQRADRSGPGDLYYIFYRLFAARLTVHTVH